MICIKCDNETFAEKPDALIEQEFRGEKLNVKTTTMACTQCGWTTLTLKQTDELRRLTADAYRKKHGLLTSGQIKAARKQLNMSQREFAAFLGVGEASVKRWETWLVQEKGNDQLMRLKCKNEIRREQTQNVQSRVYLTVPQECYMAAKITMQQNAKGFAAPQWAGRDEVPCQNNTTPDEEFALTA
jgi:putative zinc finger/helix-turn-helix YgiT family protein